jgi:exosortase/archaeosortase family protein
VRRFVILLIVLVVVFNALFYGWLSKTSGFDAYLALNASVSADVLRLFGEEATSSGMVLSSPRYQLTIKRGCDAIQASGFFALLVAASPLSVGMGRRALWMIGGTLFLLLVNLLRIISLYYTGIWYPQLFEVMHVEVWQVAFIVLPILLWLYWIRRVGRPAAVQRDAA